MSKGRWPFPGDSPAAASRRIALAYRALAEEMAERLAKYRDLIIDEGDDPRVQVSDMDKRFRTWGQGWVNPSPTSYDPDDMVTAEEAGALIGVVGGTISSMRLRNRLNGEYDGKRFLYRVSDVYQLADQVRRRKNSPTVRVNDSARGVS